MSLRAELLRFPRPDGGLDLYDPLLERITSLTRDEAHALQDGALPERLAGALLLDGPAADALRERAWLARQGTNPTHSNVAPIATIAGAAGLPTLVGEAWRSDEPWRRLAEERAAGRERLVLRGFLTDEAVDRLTLPGTWTRMETELVSAWRMSPPPELLRLLANASLRALAGAALGVDLPPGVVGNAWRMGPGDGMRPHPDGRRYVATWALGLCERWTAADGGAIAFGVPTREGFVVHERWLPFRGDLCLFIPRADAWHVVESPRRERLTVSGWWV